MNMEKKERSDGEASTMSEEFQAFCHLVDRERARWHLIAERNRRSSGKESARSRTVTWIPTFEVEDFKMAAEGAHSDHDEPSSSNNGRSSHLGGMEGERVLIGAKRMRELAPLCTAGEKRHKSNAGGVSGCALDLNTIEESLDAGN
ncbi:hypothetical protein OPV22_012360 [Ensete ventricosum]|uniref:Uncharacterized protein n=1 Tax=Ensete ventricosum TaxID=4639 RepID=A0AAV8PKX6_ENSVE|nr:hypothetical protein OPV22_012360 [Ensete ventricosum]